MNDIVLSLCIPTNGINEWVFPVLDSIYRQAGDLGKFEVIVTNNGENDQFNKQMTEYKNKHCNLIYTQNNSVGFTNQIECFKLAHGKLIKFINHRMTLVEGALDYLINYAIRNSEIKPVTYFSNGELILENNYVECSDFDQFMMVLRQWSSWSAGISIWKDDLCRIDFSKEYSVLFPHTFFLFSNTTSSKYVVDNKRIVSEITVNHHKKGNYNLFKAFAIEYPNLMLSLLKDNKISINAYIVIKKDLTLFISGLIWDFIIKNTKTSYVVEGYKEYCSVYFSYLEILCNIPKMLFYRLKRKIKRLSN